jgi:hypothetical protein
LGATSDATKLITSPTDLAGRTGTSVTETLTDTKKSLSNAKNQLFGGLSKLKPSSNSETTATDNT